MNEVARLTQLENRVAALEADIAELRAHFQTFKSQLE